MVLVATQVKRRRGTTAENDAFTGAEGEITVDIEKHELRVHDGVTQGGFVIGSSGGSGSGRNIGDIFYTTRTDTALTGAVECDGGTYNTEDYEGEGSIGELLEAGKLDYISLTDYATAISTKGWCDKIGWNGTGTTSFRVPTLTPHIIQTNNIPVVGNGKALGLTNGTATGVLMQGTQAVTGTHKGNAGINAGATASASTLGSSGIALGVITDSSTSGIIADTSDTAQLRVMFQLFNGTTDEAVATVGTVVAQVGALNSHRVIDFQIPTAENGYTWYRKYADGLVEQGGFKAVSSGNNSIPMPITMSGNYGTYTAQVTAGVGSSNARIVQVLDSSTSTTLNVIANSGFDCFWQVNGMSAQ